MIEKGTEAGSHSFRYDQDAVQGEHATVSAMNPDKDEELQPKKKIMNDGTFAVSFPDGYSGRVVLLVEGEDGGSDGPQEFNV